MGHTIVILVDCLRPPDQNKGYFAPGSEGLFLLRLGVLLAGSGEARGRVLLCRFLTVPEGEAVSSYSVAAQAMRQKLEGEALAALAQIEAELSEESRSPSNAHIAPVVRVALENELAQDARRFLRGEDGALALLPFRRLTRDTCPWIRKALRNPLPCDVAWARPPAGYEQEREPDMSRGKPFHKGMKVLLPARGGPQAVLAMEIARDLTIKLDARATVLHVLKSMPELARATEEAPFAEFMDEMERAERRNNPLARRFERAFVVGADPQKNIIGAAEGHDMLIMGTGGRAAADIGSFTEGVAKGVDATVVALKTKTPVIPEIQAARARARTRMHAIAPEALSLLVDKWFAENTFDAGEFSDLRRMVELKRQQGVTISLGLPALNEEATIGDVITVLKRSLMEEVPLVDEIVLIDSNSTDRTREIAAELGVPVHIHQEVLPETGVYSGKGEALWKSLQVLKGDIVAWVDTDVVNMQPQFVYGLVGPLLREPRIGYVKGYYHRPIRTERAMQQEGGGRVTELTARPLINLFFPLLSGLVQPLAGEYAGRRSVLEKIPFFSGYGVEVGMLIDILEGFGLDAIGQVNLESRVHRNRPLSDLSLTAFAIVQVIMGRVERRQRTTLLEEVNTTMKLIRFEKDHLSLEVRNVRDVERPPMLEIAKYWNRGKG
ncbi:MAG TPA: glucosyl-3-phosphoglycerate synthase [Chloroflexia bacterium]|nr:glucosyl-3-phosphoglycerate synthase [Chloroflexia bacterium]